MVVKEVVAKEDQPEEYLVQETIQLYNQEMKVDFLHQKEMQVV